MVAESSPKHPSLDASGSQLAFPNQHPAPSIPLDDLLAAAKAGQRNALGSLLQWYVRYLTILASRQLDGRIRRRVSPSDVVQEALLAAHRDFHGFRGASQGELLAWLRKILIHSLHRNIERHIKAAKRDVRRDIPIDHTASTGEDNDATLMSRLPATTDSPSADIRRRENRVEMCERLGGLSQSHRDIILCRLDEGLSFAEIAERTGKSENAVRMLWLRALTSLRKRDQKNETDR